MRIKLVVAYDGTDFCGWAAQKPGTRTVQGTLTEAVRRISGEVIEIIGASRTDSGAHARGQVCHFDTEVPIEPSKWTRTINKQLPPDVRIVRSETVLETFNSRFMAQDRFYRYAILHKLDDPFRARYAHVDRHALDLERMQEAAKYLVGEHDFRAFTQDLDPCVENTVRKLRSVEVKRIGDEIRIEIVGTAFLKGMMRRMSGGLFEVGKGQRAPIEMKELLTEKRNDLRWPVVLPAKGLTLMRVRYGRHPKDHRLGEE